MANTMIKLKLVDITESTREIYIPKLSILSEPTGAEIYKDSESLGIYTNHTFLHWSAGTYEVKMNGYDFDPVSITESETPDTHKTLVFMGTPS
jgi:hypothetical protein